MVTCIGEILVDVFIDGDNKTIFPGGAPFNVACNIANFDNKEVYFYGVVGKDDNGQLLLDFANKKINHLYIDILNKYETTQAIVSLKDGERSFKFIRGADYQLNVSNVKQMDFNKINVVHLGSLMLCYQSGRDFIDDVIKYVRANSGALISFDVNYRDDIFNNPLEAKKAFLNVIKQADVIKFTEEELELLSGQKGIKRGLELLLNDKQIAVVTLGKKGSLFYNKDKYIKMKSYPLKPIDTTGAGDAFYSYFLYKLDKGLDINNVESIKEALFKANIVGGLTTQKKGAIDSAPNLEELETFIKEHSLSF